MITLATMETIIMKVITDIGTMTALTAKKLIVL
jgi:hypothetical protein